MEALELGRAGSAWGFNCWTGTRDGAGESVLILMEGWNKAWSVSGTWLGRHNVSTP
jgi:hypothetical protein